MIKKIGFIGANENLIFFQKVAREQFRNFPVQIFYLEKKPKSFLDPQEFTYVKGTVTNIDSLKKFIDLVDFIIPNSIDVDVKYLAKISNLDQKIIPKISAYSAFGNKKKVKQLINYLNIPSQNFWSFNSPKEFISVLPLLKYPIVIKKQKHYQSLPSVVYIPKLNDNRSFQKSLLFIQKFKRGIVEEYDLVYGNFTTIVWRSSLQKNTIVSNNICIYREGVLLMVQPNYVKKKINEQIVNIINTMLNKINEVGIYIFEFYELKKLKIILTNFKIGFDTVGNVDVYNYVESQYSYYLRYIFEMNEPIENKKVNNLGGLMVIGKTYSSVKNLCEQNKKFIFKDFFKTDKRWFTCHGLVLCNRAYKSHKQNRQLFKELYKFAAPT